MIRKRSMRAVWQCMALAVAMHGIGGGVHRLICSDARCSLRDIDAPVQISV